MILEGVRVIVEMAKRVAPVVAVAIVVASTFAAGYHHGSKVTGSEWALRWSERDVADRKAAVESLSRQHDQEQEWQRGLDEIREQSKDVATAARRSINAANAESGRLQVGIQSAINQLARGGSATERERKARSASGVLLTQLYGEIDQLARRYAEEADRAYNAGRQCEMSYDLIRGKK